MRLAIRQESDLTDAVKNWLSNLDQDCAGTMHQVRDMNLPCMGHGKLLSSVDIDTREYKLDGVQSGEMAKFLDAFGIKDISDGPVVHVHPAECVSCPCVTNKESNRKEYWLKQQLNAKVFTETEKKVAWVMAYDKLHNGRKSIFIQTTKNVNDLLFYLSTDWKYSVSLFESVEFGQYVVREVNEKKEWKPKGLYILQSLDSMHITDFMQKQVQYLIKKSGSGIPRLIITSSVSLDDFADKFTGNMGERMALFGQLKEMVLLNV